MSKSLQPHGLQHARLPCPSPTPGAYSNSCPSHRWCHPTISSSVIPFSSHLQSFPESESFQMNESVLCIQWPNYWSFNFSISPSIEYSELISLKWLTYNKCCWLRNRNITKKWLLVSLISKLLFLENQLQCWSPKTFIHKMKYYFRISFSKLIIL